MTVPPVLQDDSSFYFFVSILTFLRKCRIIPWRRLQVKSFSAMSIPRSLHLLVDGSHQMAGRDAPEGFVVHQADEDVFIAIHTLNE